MKLCADLDVCMRSGQCHHLAPKLVGWRDDDYPEILVTEISSEDEEAAREIVEMCPSMALSLED